MPPSRKALLLDEVDRGENVTSAHFMLHLSFQLSLRFDKAESVA